MVVLWVGQYWEASSNSEMVCLIGWVLNRSQSEDLFPHCGVSRMLRLMKQPPHPPFFFNLWALPLWSNLKPLSLCSCVFLYVCVCAPVSFPRFQANRSPPTVWSRGSRRNAWRWWPQMILEIILSLVSWRVCVCLAFKSFSLVLSTVLLSKLGIDLNTEQFVFLETKKQTKRSITKISLCPQY